VTDKVTVAGGSLLEPSRPAASLAFRRRGWALPRSLVVNFEHMGSVAFRPGQRHSPGPSTFEVLEPALRAALARDPTQPWYPYYLGQAAWWQGRKDEAAEHWGGCSRPMRSQHPVLRVRAHGWAFWRYGQTSGRADHEEALRRRSRLGDSAGPLWLIERLVAPVHTC
jgi:hypothetical protein